MPALACQAMPIPYREDGSAGATGRRCGPGLAGASGVVAVLVAAGGDGVAIMVTPGGKFTTL